MAGPGHSRFITFAVVAIGVIAAGVGLALAQRRGGKRRKRSPNSAEKEVEDDTTSAVSGRDRLLPEEDGRFLTFNGVNDYLLEEDGSMTEGGFGTILFFASKSKPTKQFALKKAKDTPAGRRQMVHEATFFAGLRHLPPLENVVRVGEVTVSPTPMLLMMREESTLADMLEGGGDTIITDVARVLDGALSGVEALFGAGFFHRDLKPDNILIGRDGRGVLVDFGLVMKTSEASSGHGLGDGTLEYSAPETELQGWSLQAEIFSIFACFAEAVLGRCLFGGEELLVVKGERVAYLEAEHEDSADDVKYFGDEVARAKTAPDGEEARGDLLQELEEGLHSAAERRETTRVQLWRLKLDVGSWIPSEAALAKINRMGPPLGFFISTEEGIDDDQDLKHMAVCREAKAQPSKLFEEGWPNWLPSSSKVDLKGEVHRTMDFVIGVGVLSPDPGARPSTVESTREVLMTAALMYEGAHRGEL